MAPRVFNTIAYAVLACTVLAQSDMPLSKALQKILSHAGEGPLYTYPTDLTQGIVPKVGCISVEADVWLYNNTLYVGHEESALKTERTLSSLYIQPILSVLRAQNPTNSTFVTTGPTKNGVYDTSGGQTLYLFIDVKTDGPTTWPAVIKELQPLREAGYLTTYSTSDGVVSGPVTVIGTGNTPLNQVQGVSPRDYFYDAPLANLSTTASNITSDVSPIASVSFSSQFGQVRNADFNQTQEALLEKQIKTAHDKGIKVRYWDQPGWPVNTRNAVWKKLWDAGADLLNVDDLEGAANFWEGV